MNPRDKWPQWRMIYLVNHYSSIVLLQHLRCIHYRSFHAAIYAHSWEIWNRTGESYPRERNRNWNVSRLIDWSIDRLIDWLVGCDWLVGFGWWVGWMDLVGWWVGWLNGWLVVVVGWWWVGWLDGGWVSWLVGWLNGCMVGGCVSWMVGWLVGWMVGWWVC